MGLFLAMVLRFDSTNFELQLGAGFVARKENFVPQIVNKLIFAPRS